MILVEAPVMLNVLMKDGAKAVRGSATSAWMGASIEARADVDCAVITTLETIEPGAELSGMHPSCGLRPVISLLPEH